MREDEKTQQFWTQPWVPGRRYGDTRPVFVLVFTTKFSAAEEFTYNLQRLNRATIVGEPTRGSAHPGESRWITPHCSLFVPGGRAIDPITQSNWEDGGVEPDVRVSSDDALRTAQLLALERIGAQRQKPERKTEIDDRVRVLQGDAQHLTGRY